MAVSNLNVFSFSCCFDPGVQLDLIIFAKRNLMCLPRAIRSNYKILVTGFPLFLVLRSVEPARLIEQASKIQPGYILFLLMCYWFGQVACTQRWRLIAASFGLGGKFLSFLQIYFVCMFFNTGLPSLIGGDAIKAHLVSRNHSQPLRLGLATVLQDRASDWLALILYGTLAAMLAPIAWCGIPLAWIYLLLRCAFISVVFLVWKGTRL
jgi:uncharacterized protein (TIRG00374 family)